MVKHGLKLVLVFLTGCAAQSEFHQPRQLKALQQHTGLTLTIAARSLSVAPWDIRYQEIHSYRDPQFRHYFALFNEEITKLPADLLCLSGLNAVAFVRALAVGAQPRAAVPDYVHEVLYYDVAAQGDTYLRHVVHHEFYHMLEQQLYGSAYYKDALWQSLNVAGFIYGNGGANARDASVSVFTHPQPGFINGYALSGLEEDKAEMWAIIWAEKSWQKVQAIIASDDILQQKLRLLIAQLQCQAPGLAKAWPDYVRPYMAKGAACDVLTSFQARQQTVGGTSAAVEQ